MEECEVCKILKKTCKELGDEKFCIDLIEDLKKDKINEEELVDKITKRFGPEKFGGAWDNNVDG
jgi:hypothetical protein